MDKFLIYVASLMDVRVEDISGNTSYESIPQWDSLMHLRLVAEIEEEYEVEIPIDKVPDVKTLADFYSYISK